MKLSNILLLSTAICLVGCAGDETTTTTKHRAARYNDRDSEPLEKQPRIGMTENQIRHMYGEPNSVNHSGRGDIWTYWFNRGAAFIPYNFGYQARTGVFMFDANGRLREFNWNE